MFSRSQGFVFRILHAHILRSPFDLTISEDDCGQANKAKSELRAFCCNVLVCCALSGSSRTSSGLTPTSI